MYKKLVVRGEIPKAEASDIPDHAMNRIGKATLHAIEKFFEIPGVKEDYEIWLKEYRAKEAACK